MYHSYGVKLGDEGTHFGKHPDSHQRWGFTITDPSFHTHSWLHHNVAWHLDRLREDRLLVIPHVDQEVCPDRVRFVLQTHAASVLLFWKLNNMFLGYFDPEKILVYNENK